MRIDFSNYFLNGHIWVKLADSVVIAGILSMCFIGVAYGEYLVIDGVLGERVKSVPGIENMSQQDVAYEGVLFALSPEGWDLESVGGVAGEYGPPAWQGGIEWSLSNVPAEHSSDWGYELNAEAQQHGNRRHLMFHTDDTVYRWNHDVCEPSPYGVISGFMDGVLAQCGMTSWGVFYVTDTVSASSGSATWGQIKALY